MSLRSRRRLEVLRQEHWSAIPMDRLDHFLRGSRSAVYAVFIYFGSPCRISEDFVPSHGHLVSSWFTGGYEWPALILASNLSVEQSLILLSGRARESRRAKSHLAGISHPGWIQLLVPETGCLLAVGSIDDAVPGLHLCFPHLICAASMLRRDKQQRDAPLFPSLYALISKDWVLASRCYNRNHLCSTWDQYLTAGSNLYFCIKCHWVASQQKLKAGAFPVVQMCG